MGHLVILHSRGINLLAKFLAKSAEEYRYVPVRTAVPNTGVDGAQQFLTRKLAAVLPSDDPQFNCNTGVVSWISVENVIISETMCDIKSEQALSHKLRDNVSLLQLTGDDMRENRDNALTLTLTLTLTAPC